MGFGNGNSSRGRGRAFAGPVTGGVRNRPRSASLWGGVFAATPKSRESAEGRSLPSNRRTRSISTQMMDSLRFRNEIDPSAATAWQREGARWCRLHQNPFRSGTSQGGPSSGTVCRNSFADNQFVLASPSRPARLLPFNSDAILPESTPPSTGILHPPKFSGKIPAYP